MKNVVSGGPTSAMALLEGYAGLSDTIALN
jgi:hypothetical protein